MKVTKDKLIDDIFIIYKKRIKKNHVKQVVNTAFKLMQNSLVKGETIEIRNFGVFKVVRSKRTVVRNIREKKPMTIPRQKVVRFKLSKQLKHLMNR